MTTLFIECGGDLVTPTGTFTSPNYPGLYAHSRECIWRITVQPGRRVKLTFNDFALENSFGCNYDYVAVSRCLWYGDISVFETMLESGEDVLVKEIPVLGTMLRSAVVCW